MWWARNNKEEEPSWLLSKRKWNIVVSPDGFFWLNPEKHPDQLMVFHMLWHISNWLPFWLPQKEKLYSLKDFILLMSGQATDIYMMLLTIIIRYNILGHDLYKPYILIVNINELHHAFVFLCVYAPLSLGWALLCHTASLPPAVTQVRSCGHDASHAYCITAACALLELLSGEEAEFISFLSGHMQTHGFQRMYNGSKEKWAKPSLFLSLSSSGNGTTAEPLAALYLSVDFWEDGIPVAECFVDS